jgi:hypothetical protein
MIRHGAPNKAFTSDLVERPGVIFAKLWDPIVASLGVGPLPATPVRDHTSIKANIAILIPKRVRVLTIGMAQITVTT